jgi:hypothetical protein
LKPFAIRNSLKESGNRLYDKVRPLRLVAISWDRSFEDEPVRNIRTFFFSVSLLTNFSQPSISWISSKNR